MQHRTVKLSNIKTVVLDEADRMLDMGFKKDMDRILKTIPSQRQTVLFSATISKEIMAITKNYQRSARHINIKQDTLTVKSVKQFYTTVNSGSKKSELLSMLSNNEYPLSLIFVNTKRMADNLCTTLKKNGFCAGALHGDMNQQRRNSIMKSYRTGELGILVATDVAARGIDVSNIDIVINYDIPNDSDSYVHRIGRTGRADKCGIAHTFIYRQEMSKLNMVMRDTKAIIKPAESFVDAG
jgi:ATP-dependent RNA helicase DeaD